jgi:hypothetical protein
MDRGGLSTNRCDYRGHRKRRGATGQRSADASPRVENLRGYERREKEGLIDLEPALRSQLNQELTSGYLMEGERACKADEIADYALFAGGRFF